MKKALTLLWAPVIAAALFACASQTQVQSPYDDTVERADVLLEIPALRQYGGYTCGTTCVQMLMNRLFPYEGDFNLTAYEEAPGTTEEAGTPPENITRFFAENGVTAAAKEHMTVSEPVAALDSHHPMLMCMQAWSSAVGGAEVSDFGRRTCFVTCAQKREKAFMHYDD